MRKKYTHAVDDEQYPMLVRVTKGKFLKPVVERNKKAESAVVQFQRAKGKFKTKDGALMYNSKKVSVAIIFYNSILFMFIYHLEQICKWFVTVDMSLNKVSLNKVCL